MSHRSKKRARSWGERALSLFLAAVLLLGTVPALTLPASAHWADEYLDKLVDWGVMRADQTGNPDAPVTRAEFAGVINRAYGYTESGPIPFEDVAITDWFYDDISIAYTAGYMAGTSATTASPNDTLTREMAVCILGRNMMMKETPGESLAFSDSRDISFWAQGMVKTAVDNYIISGYPDNSFGPQDSISKGQMAVLVSQCVGSPVNASGTYEMGGVFGNVTITAPNVTLRNTTISGDLYVSGGVGLGGIKLENVNVLGRIIVSGTGESEGGDASVVMRNVTANEMLVDNMRNKTVTVRADGITDIAKTVVRTSAYLEDNNTDDKGLMHIELDGESGTRLTLAGRIKEVVDKTPNSYVQVGKGTVAKLTVDEAAINSVVQLDRNTEVKEMNLDVAANVTGEGDIEKLNVNAPGSVVAMLPDKIYIRPGLTGNIAGVVMDHQAAEEGSLDPRLLSGYPAAKDIAPTGFRADFAGNKKGTIYWAVSNITDGSIGEDDLISPPTYNSKAIRNGSVAEPTGGTEVNAQVTGLTVGGSYYLSAILVDDQGNRSPVKVISFTTPDNTVPAFGQGYPYISFIGKEHEGDAAITAQVTVLPTKSCRLYYAVLPQGAQAPTENELKAAAVSGNLGYGVVDLTKNEELPIIVSRRLEEMKDYVLYLWLTDIDGANSSAVTSLPIRTPDVTPPRFVVDPYPNREAQATSVQLGAAINENGTIYWAVVESGTAYPKPNSQNENDNEPDGKTARLDSDYAKLQVANGMNALVRGQVTATANNEVNITINGLQAEKSYDFYYLAQDTAGNYTVQVYKLEGGIRTLDTNAPTIRQFFTSYDGTDNTKNPMRDTDIVLEFSENVCFTNAGSQDLLSLYQATQEGSAAEQEAAVAKLAEALRSSITLKAYAFGIPNDAAVKGDAGVGNDWVIDYTEAKVANVGGKIQLTFPNSGLQLASGGSYHFEITNLEDMSGHPLNPATVNYLAPAETGHNVPQFTVVFARVQLTSQFILPTEQLPEGIPQGYQADLFFRMIPNSTETVSDDISYNLLLWNDVTGGDMNYDLYYRAVTPSGRVLTVEQDENNSFLYGMPNMESKVHGVDKSGWVLLGNSGPHYSASALSGKSLHGQFNNCSATTYPKLNKLYSVTQDSQEETIWYDFVISIRSMKGSSDPKTWSGDVNFYVDVAAGTSSSLAGLGNAPTETAWQDFVTNGLNSPNGGETIGAPSPAEAADNDPRRLHIHRKYTDSLQPAFTDGFPTFDTTEDSVTMNLTLDRAGTIYYVIGYADTNGREPANGTWYPSITTLTTLGSPIKPEEVPKNGSERDAQRPKMPELNEPAKGNIQSPGGWSGGSLAVAYGSVNYPGVAIIQHEIPDLQPNRTYYVYFVIAGTGAEPSEVEMYKFKTDPVSRPVITLSSSNTGGTSGVNMSTDMNSTLTWILYPEENIRQVKWMDNVTKLSEVLNPDLSLPVTYQNYTIFQALTEPYDYDVAKRGGTYGYFPTDGSGDPESFEKRYSVFDIYASNEAKSKFMSWLQIGSAVSGGGLETDPPNTEPVSTSKGSFNLTANRGQLGATEAQADTPYYVLTMACRNPLDANAGNNIGLNYSFMGLQFQISDAEPPELTDAIGGFSMDSSGRITNGSIVLYFDKELYKGKGNKIGEHDIDKFLSNKTGIDVDNSVITSSDRGAEVTLHLTGDGASVLASGGMSFGLSNSSGVVANKNLLIRRSPTDWPDRDGNYIILVTWGDRTWRIPGSKETPVDTEPPELRVGSVTGGFNVSGSTDALAGGSITLRFSKPLYQGSGNQLTAITTGQQFFEGSLPTCVASATVVNSNTDSVVTINWVNTQGNVYIQDNNPVSFTSPSVGYLKNASGTPATKALTITIERGLTTTGLVGKTVSYTMTVKWGDDVVATILGTIV